MFCSIFFFFFFFEINLVCLIFSWLYWCLVCVRKYIYSKPLNVIVYSNRFDKLVFIFYCTGIVVAVVVVVGRVNKQKRKEKQKKKINISACLCNYSLDSIFQVFHFFFFCFSNFFFLLLFGMNFTSACA